MAIKLCFILIPFNFNLVSNKDVHEYSGRLALGGDTSVSGCIALALAEKNAGDARASRKNMFQQWALRISRLREKR